MRHVAFIIYAICEDVEIVKEGLNLGESRDSISLNLLRLKQLNQLIKNLARQVHRVAAVSRPTSTTPLSEGALDDETTTVDGLLTQRVKRIAVIIHDIREELERVQEGLDVGESRDMLSLNVLRLKQLNGLVESTSAVPQIIRSGVTACGPSSVAQPSAGSSTDDGNAVHLVALNAPPSHERSSAIAHSSFSTSPSSEHVHGAVVAHGATTLDLGHNYSSSLSVEFLSRAYAGAVPSTVGAASADGNSGQLNCGTPEILFMDLDFPSRGFFPLVWLVSALSPSRKILRQE